MITKQQAVDISIKKWESLSRGESPDDYNCGFCEYTGEQVTYCSGCPLSPDVCGAEDKKPLYWRHAELEETSSKAIRLAKLILAAIMIRGQAWIEEETK